MTKKQKDIVKKIEKSGEINKQAVKQAMYAFGIPVKEIAQITGVSKNTVRSALYRGKRFFDREKNEQDLAVVVAEKLYKA